MVYGKCRSCGVDIIPSMAYIINGVYISGTYDNTVIVCGPMCVANFIESLVDFPEITTRSLSYQRMRC